MATFAVLLLHVMVMMGLSMADRSFTLTTNHAYLKPQTTPTVSLECKGLSAIMTTLRSVLMIRIVKRDERTLQWRPYAEIRDVPGTAKDDTHSKSCTVDGNIEQHDHLAPTKNPARVLDDTFLKINFTAPSEEAAGVYRCEVVGISASYDVIWEKSLSTAIRITPDLLLHEVQNDIMTYEAHLADVLTAKKEETLQMFTTKIQEMINLQTEARSDLEDRVRNEIRVMSEELMYLSDRFSRIDPKNPQPMFHGNRLSLMMTRILNE